VAGVADGAVSALPRAEAPPSPLPDVPATKVLGQLL
jgi:hypothetical protein